VAKAIADELRLHLTGREEQIITARPTDNPEAYDAYLRGAAYALRAGNTPANALGAQKYLREAVKLDARMAVGWALLATVDALGYINHNLQPTVRPLRRGAPGSRNRAHSSAQPRRGADGQGTLSLLLPQGL